VVAVFAPPGYWELMGSILTPTEDYNVASETGRLAIWTRGIGYVAQYPILGVGPDNFIRAGWMISDVGSIGLAGVGLRDQAPHNTFLQVWAELGTVGLVVWLVVIATGIIQPLRMRRRFPTDWLIRGTSEQRFLVLMSSYLPVSYIGFSVTSFFVSHAYTSIFYALTAMLAGFLVVSQRMLSQNQGGRDTKRQTSEVLSLRTVRSHR
jgi:O-antigen ligase